jgi:S-adenosylmethionine/arginine decarboxylase-like enzyme
MLFALAESHVSIHTFPEHGSLSADAYTCGEGNPKIIMISLLQYCNSDNYQLRELSR